MSDLLIKGMEMPQHCGYCRFRYDGICHALQKTQYSPNDCPLVEVPTPHGRLIDADILMGEVAKLMPSWTTPDGTGLHDNEIMAAQEAIVDIMQTIFGQPTVIEAEE